MSRTIRRKKVWNKKNVLNYSDDWIEHMNGVNSFPYVSHLLSKSSKRLMPSITVMLFILTMTAALRNGVVGGFVFILMLNFKKPLNTVKRIIFIQMNVAMLSV